MFSPISSPISSAIHFIINDADMESLSIVAFGAICLQICLFGLGFYLMGTVALASFFFPFFDPASFARGFASVSTRLIRYLIRRLPPRNAIFGWPRNVIFGCAGASWLAARAFTSATLSVGEFQWEYKKRRLLA